MDFELKKDHQASQCYQSHQGLDRVSSEQYFSQLIVQHLEEALLVKVELARCPLGPQLKAQLGSKLALATLSHSS
jgi:hypothetical protein